MNKIYVQFDCGHKTMLSEITDIIKVMEKNFKDKVEYGCQIHSKKKHLAVILETDNPKHFFSKFKGKRQWRKDITG